MADGNPRLRMSRTETSTIRAHRQERVDGLAQLGAPARPLRQANASSLGTRCTQVRGQPTSSSAPCTRGRPRAHRAPLVARQERHLVDRAHLDQPITRSNIRGGHEHGAAEIFGASEGDQAAHHRKGCRPRAHETLAWRRALDSSADRLEGARALSGLSGGARPCPTLRADVAGSHRLLRLAARRRVVEAAKWRGTRPTGPHDRDGRRRGRSTGCPRLAIGAADPPATGSSTRRSRL